MPCVSCPLVSKGLKGQACLAAHCFSLPICILNTMSLTAWQAFPFYWSQKTKEDQHMVTKQRFSSARRKQIIPVLPSLVKMRVVRGNIYRAQIETPIILLWAKFGLHNIPVVFKRFPLLTCIQCYLCSLFKITLFY